MRTVSRSGQNASQEIDCEARIYAFDLWFTARNVERDFQDRLVLSTKKNEKACGFFVDANVLAICRVNRSYKRILSNADFNFIDGRLVALLVSWFLGTKISAYPGPKFFDSFCSVPGRHLIIGGSRDHFDDVVQEIHKRGYDDATFTFLDVPFCNVDEFDFEKIGKDINDLQPDIVWVSLGAPKQEIFIMNVLPYVNRGYFFAVGAALGFFSGRLVTTEKYGRFPVVWMMRLIKEPTKQFRRCVFIASQIPTYLYWVWRRRRGF